MKQSKIQEYLHKQIQKFYKGLYVPDDALADKGDEEYKKGANYDLIKFSLHDAAMSRDTVRAFRRALLHAKKYNRQPYSNAFRGARVTTIQKDGVASNPIALDELSEALTRFCQAMHPKEDLQRHERDDRSYKEYIYPLYDYIMLAKRALALDALCEHDTAVGRCLAHLIQSRLAGTPKGNTILAEVMGCLKQQEQDQRDYMMRVLTEKTADQKSILDEIEEKVNVCRHNKGFNKKRLEQSGQDITDPEKWLEQFRQDIIDNEIYRLQNQEPHKTVIANNKHDSMRQWLSKNVTENSVLMQTLKTHRRHVSWYKDTYSIRCLQVAMVSDFIKENQAIYGSAFLEAYNALSPSGNKAFVVATALQTMAKDITTKEDFIAALQSDNALTKALKMRTPGMSIFGSSKTWQRVQDKVLPELDPNTRVKHTAS